VPTPADAVVLQGAAHAIVSHGAVVEADTARAETPVEDLFTDQEHGVEAAADAVETALRDAGAEPRLRIATSR
jgi:hypothetical protein